MRYTNITHELRTPLTLILGPLEDIQKDNSLSGKDAQKISVIHQSAIRLLNLINQILEFRKTETQNKKLCVSRDNIVTPIHEIGLKYKELNRKAAVDIHLEIENDAILMYFDKEILQIVLDNLISNALKYTEKGSITIGIRQTQHAEVNYAEIRVSDTGYGIKPEALPHIFDRYYQEGGKHPQFRQYLLHQPLDRQYLSQCIACRFARTCGRKRRARSSSARGRSY